MEIDRNAEVIFFEPHEMDALSRPGDYFPRSVPLDTACAVLSRAYARRNEVQERDISSIPQGAQKVAAIGWLFRTTQNLNQIIADLPVPAVDGADDFLRSLSEG